MALIIARGQLQHHFWGEYSASIVLKFHSAFLAHKALEQLPGFKVHSNPDFAYALTFYGKGADLKAVEALLVSKGADKKKLNSMAKSIDYGEPFNITVDLTPADTDVVVQGDLFA
jgi:hypothetical protein